MRVIANKPGFYKAFRIRVGQEFDVPEGTTGKWFSPAPAGSETKKAEAAKGKPHKGKSGAPETFSELSKQDGDAQGNALV